VLEAPLSGDYARTTRSSSRVEVPKPFGIAWVAAHAVRTVGEEDEGVPFEIESRRWPRGDRSDRRVDLRGLRSQAHDARRRAQSRSCSGVSSRPTAFASKRIVLQEAVLAIGERIAVFGAGVFEPDRDGASQDQGYRDGGPTRFGSAAPRGSRS
jgi:hypothetical protein